MFARENSWSGTGELAELVRWLLLKRENPSSDSQNSNENPGIVVCIRNPSTVLGKRQVDPRAFYPASLVEPVNPRFSGILCIKQ